jgi:hypothetical protein
MQAFFLTAFIAGLILNIYWIIRGTERWRGRDAARRLDAFGRELTMGTISLRTPIVGSFASSFGLIGYVLARYASASVWIAVGVAAAAAALAVAGAILLVKKWAVPQAMKEAPDERYLLQGHLAKVTHAIPYGGVGEVEYIVDDKRFTLPARSITDGAVGQGVDVVLERVEDGIVFVEEWALVEQRL